MGIGNFFQLFISPAWFSRTFYPHIFLNTNAFASFLFLKMMFCHFSTISFDYCYPVTRNCIMKLSFDWTKYTPTQCCSDSIWFIILSWYDSSVFLDHHHFHCHPSFWSCIHVDQFDVLPDKSYSFFFLDNSLLCAFVRWLHSNHSIVSAWTRTCFSPQLSCDWRPYIPPSITHLAF